MRVAVIVLLSCVASTQATKGKLLSKLRHHKRGAFGALPTYKLGYDIPYVTHSVVKPLLVTYPPTAVPLSVKVPLHNPLAKYPLPVGHRVPVPHPHHGLKFPHFHKVLFSKPPPHFHHHHHHVAPKPILPEVPVATPVAPVPVPQPSVPVAQPVPAPPVLLPAPTHPLPIAAPAPTLQILPQQQPLHLRPILPAPVAIQPPSLYPQYPYVIRPGNAVQSSVFATYPKYPLVNYPTPVVETQPLVPHQQLYYDHSLPHYHLLPQAQEYHQHASDPPFAHPTHAPVDHDGWTPVPPGHPHPEVPQFTQEQGTQVYEHHTGEHYPELHQLSHVQHQIHELEQAQYEQHQHQHQPEHEEYDQQPLQQEYGPPEQHLHQEYGVPHQHVEGRSYPESEVQEQAYHNHIPLRLQPPIDRPLEHF